MSSEKKTWLYWIAQVSGWGIFQLLILTLSFLSDRVKISGNLILYSFISFLSYILLSHFFRFIILKKHWLRLPILSLIWRSFLFSLLFGVAYEFLDFTVSELIPKDYYLVEQKDTGIELSAILGGILLNTILFTLWVSFYFAYLFIEKSRKQEIKNLQFEASRNEIELKNLRTQINPHFLFNSLNSIKALVEIDKDQAKGAITQLSNLLRKSITLSRNRLILIREELDIVETYLALEKIRFEERINTHFDIDTNALNCQIPPLMLQTLVENALKHGLSKSINGGILMLTIIKEDNRIHISIKNTGVLQETSPDLGIGIENTKRRLKILFGDTSSFEIRQENELVAVYLKFNCKTNSDENNHS